MNAKSAPKGASANAPTKETLNSNHTTIAGPKPGDCGIWLLTQRYERLEKRIAKLEKVAQR